MGWSTQAVIAQQVIIEGPGDGLFTYSGTPALGNLVSSIAPANGTDQYGNAYLAGTTNYNPAVTPAVAVRMTLASFAFLTAPTPAGPWTTVAQETWNTSASLMQVTTPLLAVTGNVNAQQSLTIGQTFGTPLAILGPSGDTTGATDSAALNAATGPVLMLPGTWYLSAPVILGTLTEITGCGPATTVQPGSSWSGSELFLLNSTSMRLANMRIYGGSATRSANPAADAIGVGSSAFRWFIEDVIFERNNGWCINVPAVTGATHGHIDGVIANNNAGGIQVKSGTGAGVTAQIDIGGLDIQQTEVNSAFYLENVFDVLTGRINAACVGSSGLSTVHLAGQCTTCNFGILDIGVDGTATTGVPVLYLNSGGFAHSPSDCTFGGGTVQQGGVGVQLDSGCARIHFLGVTSKNNDQDGWQFNGTGTGISLTGCIGNGNGASIPVGQAGYDVDVTGLMHVGLFSFTYASGAPCTAARNLTSAVNNVSDVNPTNPGGLGNAGNAPNGW